MPGIPHFIPHNELWNVLDLCCVSNSTLFPTLFSSALYRELGAIWDLPWTLVVSTLCRLYCTKWAVFFTPGLYPIDGTLILVRKRNSSQFSQKSL
jgi:hypothetical protein